MGSRAHRFAAWTATALTLAFAAAPAAAAEGWTVRGSVVWVDPDLDVREQDGFTTITLQADSTIGLAASAEYRFTDRFGLEFGVLWAEPDVELRVEGLFFPVPSPVPIPDRIVATGDLRFTPVTAGLNVHLTPGSRADLYLGPRVAYVFYSDLELTINLFGISSTQRIDTDDEFGYGAGIGVDVPLGTGRWSFHAAADYLEVDLTFVDEGSENFAFDPLMVRAGLGVGF